MHTIVVCNDWYNLINCSFMNVVRYVITGLLFSGLVLTGSAQSVQKSDSISRAAADNLISLYSRQTGADLLIFNGSEYIHSPVSKNGFPFFAWENPVEGAVFYDGNLYQHINLQFDISRDALVYDNYLHTGLMRLVPEKISYFTLQQHLFIYLSAAKIIGLPKDGFYEVLTDDSITVLARREKILNQKLNLENISISRYDSYNNYYIKKDSYVYPVLTKRDVLKVLADQKILLLKYINTNRLNFKKHLEESLIKIATYYSGLKK